MFSPIRKRYATAFALLRIVPRDACGSLRRFTKIGRNGDGALLDRRDATFFDALKMEKGMGRGPRTRISIVEEVQIQYSSI